MRAHAESAVFDFAHLKEQAARLASAPYQEWRSELPEPIRGLTYDQYREIQFNARRAIWRYDRNPFQLHLFHPGGIQNDQVDIHVVQDGEIETLAYDPDFFTFGANGPLHLDASRIRFSGFRVNYPLNRPEKLDELAVFQGATYFRALGQGQFYGCSARTVAVNCGGPGDEEFPRFRAFWIFRPDDNDDTIRVFGLFDSPSLAGAAEFVIQPGPATVMRIRVAFHARTAVSRLGVAPLTSMYWFGRHSAWRFPDFRPEVHDSDGLLINTETDEWLWRPLINEGRTTFDAFNAPSPKGFGLMQRDRSFSSYQDLEAHYERRPSVWVKPIGDWGAGAVRLLTLPTTDEFRDNIVAFWEPQTPLAAGGSAEYVYELRWFGSDTRLPVTGRTTATRIADAGRTRKFVLDFAWPGVADDAESDAPHTEVSAPGAVLTDPVEHYNPYDRTWRVFFSATAPAGQAVELRARVTKEKQPVTETWTYLWNP